MQLANFMEELESSGLLSDAQRAHAETAGEPAQTAGDANGQADRAATPPAASSAAEPNQPQPEAAAGESAAAVGGESSEELPGAGPEQEPDQTGEQRVLGDLEGCPGWLEVMDMGGGRVYFWNEHTDEVAWDPPAGAVPRSQQANNATFAASTAVAGPGEAQASGRGAVPAQEAVPELPQQPESGAEDAVGNGVGQRQSGSQHEQGASPQQVVDLAEEGEIEASAEPGANIAVPDESVGSTGEALLARAWKAAERLCGPTPLLVRLAVEAEVRLRDWRSMSKAQATAARSGDASASLAWPGYEAHVARVWRQLEAAFPLALQEAERSSAAVAAAVADAAAAQGQEPAPEPPEDGEVPSSAEAEPPAASAPSQPPLPPATDASQPPLPPDEAAEADTVTDMDIEHYAPLPPDSAEALSELAPASTAASAGTATSMPVSSAAAQVSSSVAASATPAASGAAAAAPALPAPVLAPAPAAPAASVAAAPQWPGYYYHHHTPYLYPYLFGAVPYVPPIPPTLAAPTHAAHLVSSAASLAAPPLPTGEAAPAAAANDAPPLPAHEVGHAAAPREYSAEATRSVSPLSGQPGGAAAGMNGSAQAASMEEQQQQKKRKRGKGSGSGPPGGKKKALKLGKAASSLIDKWAAARKDLVRTFCWSLTRLLSSSSV